MKGKTGYRTGSINGLTGVISLPGGRARWSLGLLLDRMASLDYVDSLSHEKLRQLSKKESKPWQRKQWSIAPKRILLSIIALWRIYSACTNSIFRLSFFVCMDGFNNQST